MYCYSHVTSIDMQMFLFYNKRRAPTGRDSYIMEREAVQKGFMGASGAAGEAEMVAGCGC
jgi:hypothetical protein